MNGGGMENLIEQGSQGVALIVTCNTCTFFDFVTLAWLVMFKLWELIVVRI